ncbi:MAG: hypothetical protein ABJA81_01675 [Nocardioidaceae bacterium]
MSAPPSSTPTDSPDTGFDPLPGDFSAIRSVLKDRAHALTEGDQEAFIATVDSASASFLTNQRAYFANIKALPVSTVRYEMTDYALTPSSVSGDDPVLRPDITEQVFMPGPMHCRSPTRSTTPSSSGRDAGCWAPSDRYGIDSLIDLMRAYSHYSTDAYGDTNTRALLRKTST